MLVAAKEGGYVTPDEKLDLEAVKRVLADFGFDSSKTVTEDKLDSILRKLRGGPEAL